MKDARQHKMHEKTVLFLVLVGLFIGCSSPAILEAATGEADVWNLYRQAVETFREADTFAETDPDKAQGLYRKAVMRFERMVSECDIHNGRLYYNIGNGYFRIRDIGRAILNYRRAQLYIANDGNLQQNLDFARAIRIDNIEEKQETRILKTLFFWHYDLSTRARVSIFSCSFMLLWIVAIVRVFYRRPFTIWCICIAATASLLFAASLLTEHIWLQKTRPGVVISAETTARKGNSETYEPSFREPLHAGTEFVLIESRGDWYHIELPDSRKCWVSGMDVELIR